MPDVLDRAMVLDEARAAMRRCVDLYNAVLRTRQQHREALKALGVALVEIRRRLPLGTWTQLLAEYNINQHTWRRARALALDLVDYQKSKQNTNNSCVIHKSETYSIGHEITGDTGDSGDTWKHGHGSGASVAAGAMDLVDCQKPKQNTNNSCVIHKSEMYAAGRGIAGDSGDSGDTGKHGHGSGASVAAGAMKGAGQQGGGSRGWSRGWSRGGWQLRLDAIYQEAESLRADLQRRVAACLDMARSGNGVGVQALRASRDAIKAVMEGL